MIAGRVAPPISLLARARVGAQVYLPFSLAKERNLGLARIDVRHRFFSDDLCFSGKLLKVLGQGDFGRVHVHPLFPTLVIKIPAIAPGVALCHLSLTSEEVTRAAAKLTQALSDAGVGPKFIGVGEVDGIPAIVRERVFGETVATLVRARQFHQPELNLVGSMLRQMAEERLQVADVSPSNIVIGATASDWTVRAYLVDGGEMVYVDPHLSEQELFEKLWRQSFVHRGWLDPYAGPVAIMESLGVYLEDGVRRSSEVTLGQRFKRFARGLASLQFPSPRL